MKKKSKSQTVEMKKKPSKTISDSEKCTVLREDCFRIMKEDGTVDSKVEPKIDKEVVLRMYHNMVLTRAFDERGMMLQRQGRIGFYVPSFGQEAIQTGTAAALLEKDWVFPSYREPGIFLYRGAGLYEMLCNLWGNRGDLSKGRQMPVHYSFPKIKMFSVSSPIATQLIQA
ncbi:MAG: thiamine pyrophosphate-dependent enzyme, partial [Deltaproteobacteria bacterium]